jgi:acid phosphatase
MLTKVAKGTNVIHNEQVSSTASGGSSHHIAKGRGPFGKLTTVGLLQMIDVGTRIKEELEERTAWSSAVAADDENEKFQLRPDRIKIFSTDFDRTIQSAQGVLVGFFPEGPAETIDIDCRHTTSWMIPDPQPRRTSEQVELETELANRPHILEREMEMKPLAVRCTQALRPILGDDAFKMSYGVGEEERKDDDDGAGGTRHLSWAQLSEITNCLALRNMLPDGLTKEDQEATSSYCAWKWFESLRNPRLAYLSMHHFTHTIVHGMKDCENEPPVILFSCHDSSLIGLLCAFHLEQPSVWPEYGSVLKIELLEKVSKHPHAAPEDKHDPGGGNGSSTSNATKPADRVVRFYLNGELLRSMWHGHLREEISLNKLAHYTSTPVFSQ